ncbi:hypothetical protein K450DRAFT_253015 [Umbelopsis ramanniana AG]|uniref:Uncharacterized protein n=1 Tax=Umbelopsis ramanniana AG TaxID=1314678 RepID=A0AAD5E6K5_UMBRA|nr:uncharacterized protein K450DRAFT_253015 [Umbelopsis ramanniana AG]KAI8577265.1 hypothetical protein K450DRAFT_253015 [Umbelopsis ramanniana AG]
MAESSSSDGTPNLNEEPQVIRYSKEFLLSLHDSPLAVKPDDFPGLSLWFGDDWQSLNTKGALNGSTSPKTLDKNIVLGPPKTNFNSSVFGGLKHSEDATQAGKTGSSFNNTRPRQGHESRTPRDNSNADSRSQRVSHNMNDRTFGRDRTPGTERGFRGSVDKGTSEFQSRNPRMRQNERHSDRSVEPSRNKRENNRDHNTMRNAKGFDQHERTPEWMDYDPEAETTAKNKQTDSKESEAEFINDLEAWKAKMKKQNQEKSNDTVQEQATYVESVPSEKAADTPTKPIETSPEQTKDNVDDLFAKLPSNLADTTMAFDNFVISGSGSRMSASASANTSNKGGSRFAKFFSSKQHETAPSDAPKEESISPMNDGTPKSISLDTLFQSHNAVPKSQGPPMPTGKRMLSENDILQSLGAHKPSPRQPDTVNDAAGFNKVLEALSKSKPVALPPQNSPSQHDPRSSRNDQLRGMEPSGPTMNHRGGQMPMQQQIDPSILQQRRSADQQQQQHSPVLMRGASYNEYPSHNSPGRARGNSPSAYSERPKMVASNLPTSVLRQLSAKSSDSPGKSGSPVANKQPTNFSPAHPRSLQASQYPQQPSDPALYGGGYNPMPMYQRGPPPVTGGYPGSPMEMASGQNMNLEQLMQMRNNLHGGNIQSPPAQRGAVPPMPMMGNMPPFPPYMMGNPPPGSMQGPPPPGFPSEMRPPPKEHFIGMLPGANMSNRQYL